MVDRSPWIRHGASAMCPPKIATLTVLPRSWLLVRCGGYLQGVCALINPKSLGAFAQVVGYSLEAPAPPFPVFVLGYAINGFGLSLQVDHQKRSVSLAMCLKLSTGRGCKRLCCFPQGQRRHENGHIARCLRCVSSPQRLQTPGLILLSGLPVFRCRSLVLTSRCDPVLPDHSLVVPLPRIARHRALQRHRPDRRVPFQRPRQSVSASDALSTSSLIAMTSSLSR